MKIREESGQDRDPRMSALVQARKRTNSVELNALLLERHELNERCDSLLAKLQAEDRARLEAEFEAAKAAVREQLQAIEDHKTKVGRLQNEINRLADVLSGRERAVAAAVEHRRALGRYASKAEIDRADAVIEAAEKKVSEVQAKMATLQTHHEDLVLRQWPKLGERLQALTSEERRLRSAIEGDEKYQHETGLLLPAGAKF